MLLETEEARIVLVAQGVQRAGEQVLAVIVRQLALFRLRFVSVGQIPVAGVETFRQKQQATNAVAMLSEFAEKWGFTEPANPLSSESGILLAGQSYRDETWFIRVWYASDRNSFAVITYTCAWDDRAVETGGLEAIVNTVRFPGNPDPS